MEQRNLPFQKHQIDRQKIPAEVEDRLVELMCQAVVQILNAQKEMPDATSELSEDNQ